MFVWLDIMIHNVLNERKVRNLNVQRFCVISYISLNELKMVYKKILKVSRNIINSSTSIIFQDVLNNKIFFY